MMAKASIRELTEKLSELIFMNRQLTVLTGAGISTDSGIPDYRGPNGTYTIQRDYKPIRYHEFTSPTSDDYRQRYWARSFLGYPRISRALPNPSHQALARLHNTIKIADVETDARKPFINQLITQNVDSLHLKAGTPSHELIEMHGTLRNVVCLTCKHQISRSVFQDYLKQMNPNWAHLVDGKSNGEQESDQSLMHTLGVDRLNVRPDGDRDLSSMNLDHRTFKYPKSNINNSMCKCRSNDSNEQCLYKPDVVFFGENMKHKVRDDSFEAIGQCDALLVIGSSLEVYSAYRLVKMACDLRKQVMILNLGPTRASTQPLDIENYNVRCGDVLPELVDNLIKEFHK